MKAFRYKDVKVWVYGRPKPIIFVNVEEFYETRKALEIVTEDMYSTITTKIYKQAIQMYELTEQR